MSVSSASRAAIGSILPEPHDRRCSCGERHRAERSTAMGGRIGVRIARLTGDDPGRREVRIGCQHQERLYRAPLPPVGVVPRIPPVPSTRTRVDPEHRRHTPRHERMLVAGRGRRVIQQRATQAVLDAKQGEHRRGRTGLYEDLAHTRRPPHADLVSARPPLPLRARCVDARIRLVSFTRTIPSSEREHVGAQPTDPGQEVLSIAR